MTAYDGSEIRWSLLLRVTAEFVRRMMPVRFIARCSNQWRVSHARRRSGIVRYSSLQLLPEMLRIQAMSYTTAEDTEHQRIAPLSRVDIIVLRRGILVKQLTRAKRCETIAACVVDCSSSVP